MMSRVSLVVLLGAAGCGGKTAPTVIDGDNALVACPESPNCVSSAADPSDEQHYIAPFTLDETNPNVAEMATWMAGRKRCEVLDQTEDWLVAACSTAIFKFTDDVALVVDHDQGVVHVRSSSRVGRSDLGANRKRIEAMRTEWNAGF